MQQQSVFHTNPHLEGSQAESSKLKDPKIRNKFKPSFGWLLRMAFKIILVITFMSGGLLIGGFLQFANQVTSYPVAMDGPSTDGVVVLTGGSARIASGLEFLARKKSKRLLISGVNPHTKAKDIEAINPSYSQLFNCCVDMESISIDTISNATETQKWVKQNNYKSLTVVTSNYHMPRSLLEFRRAMPDIQIYSFAVQLPVLANKNWWKNATTLRFMVSEYIKYIGTNSRVYFSPETVSALRASAVGL